MNRMNVCILVNDGPRHCPGPKLTCAVSMNSFWQSISFQQRHYNLAASKSTEKKKIWKMTLTVRYNECQHWHTHPSFCFSLSHSQTHTSLTQAPRSHPAENSQLIPLIGFCFLFSPKFISLRQSEEKITFDKWTLKIVQTPNKDNIK